MGSLLDDKNIRTQRDPSGALDVAVNQYSQASFDAVVWNPEHDDREIRHIVIAGMGGSALAALFAKVWLDEYLTIPFEIVRTYDVPHYVDRSTLVIASSYSGNTEETLAFLEEAERRGSQLGVIAAGGALVDIASSYDIAHVSLPGGLQPRMTIIYGLKALASLLQNFDVIHPGRLEEIDKLAGWLGRETAKWNPDVPLEDNYAKQLAEKAVGKTPVFYGGALTAPLAYKWKISWNENAKNVAFWNEYPEFNHNEFMGWVSHPIEKPFAVFDLVSSLEHSQILKRFELSDKLLSGKRPKSTTVNLRGESILAQLLWGTLLADFVSIYVAILNNVDPTPVHLIEKLKKEL